MREFRPYVVQAGDYLAKLAVIHNFEILEVWNHPLNAELKAKRKSPDILYAGDILHIPMDIPAGEELTAKSTNVFTADVGNVEINVRLLHEDGSPVANATCEIHGMGTQSPPLTTTNDDGLVSIVIPTTIRTIDFVFHELDLVFQVDVGGMDPIEEQSGVIKRLKNLGYCPDTPDEEQLRDAIIVFQFDETLELTGEADASTRQRLVEVHGS